MFNATCHWPSLTGDLLWCLLAAYNRSIIPPKAAERRVAATVSPLDLLESSPKGPKCHNMMYLGLLYEDLKLVFWVDTSYLGTLNPPHLRLPAPVAWRRHLVAPGLGRGSGGRGSGAVATGHPACSKTVRLMLGINQDKRMSRYTTLRNHARGHECNLHMSFYA